MTETTSAPTMATESRRAAVYRLYDADGALLYIGSAYYPDERANAHRHTSWGPTAARRTEEWHDTRALAYEAEARAIRTEAPRHNIIGTPNHTGPKIRGQAMADAAAARWRSVRKARDVGAPIEEARRAGALAEIEYLDATGMFTGYVNRMKQTLAEGGTYSQWSMSID